MYKRYIWILVCYLSICVSIFASSTLPEIQAEGAILIEPKTNTILFEKNAHEKLYPASATKILTAMIILEELNQKKILTKSQDSVNVVPSDSSHIGLAVGDKISVKDALYGLLVGSDNFIAHDLAIASKGSIEKFADRMNEKAKAYGALNTHFTNPHGYHDPNHYTTPYDLAQIARETFNIPELIKIAGTAKYSVQVLNKDKSILVTNKNRLFNSQTPYYNEHVIAAKTGFHNDAQQTLVAKAVYGDMELIAVVMKVKSPGQYEDINNLFNYGKENFAVKKNEHGFYQLANQTASKWASPYISGAIKNKWIVELGINYQDGITIEGLIYMLNVAMEDKERLSMNEVIQYVGEGALQGKSKLTRLQTAKLITYLVDKWALSFDIKDAQPFIPDLDRLPIDEQEAIKFTVRRGILGAKDTVFEPNRQLSWQEAVCMVNRLVEGKKPWMQITKG